QSRAKEIDGEKISTTFDDIAGIDYAKKELQEVVDFLKNPEKYTRVGAKIPKGVLLAAGSGLGKTLLAKAVAGTAGVPFFSASASEFVEMFVGVGSSRIRNLFQKAKAKAPCIVFIDEIDAVGKARSGNLMGPGNDEREQTINQLLTEMDGFEGNTGVVVIGATNRVDILDKALLRPGRFDRIVTIDAPDVTGRTEILKVHTRGKPLDPAVDLAALAKITAGFSGAELQNLANEAAINAARHDRATITQNDFEEALEKVVMGPLKTARVISDEKRRIVAVHEAGHTVTAFYVGDYDAVRKVSIIPRGSAGGVTLFEPDADRVDSGLLTRTYLENKLVVALGGRAAEEIVYGPAAITTGASHDMEQVYKIARVMVTRYGFS
ncbi:ATP-dependent zinc metalloprotease FtsH, partial [bacterium]|nr:ATP-dependent zinc metalloprotease FtsH [bacterium]